VWRSFTDTAGRVLSTTDPLGHVTRVVPDKLNRVTTITDALNGQTAFTYDENSRLKSLTDALTHATSYTYDTSDRVATRTDPLQQTASYHYDGNDNLTQVTDRKGQVTSYQYDAVDRLSQVTYADASTVQYTYDLGNRVTQIVDSGAGTITRAYDDLNRLTSETTPEGTISYTYHADGRRDTMTVTGQTPVAYGYDDAHRLTSITQGTSVVSMTYDDADRRTTLTLPNGVVTTYDYDTANQLTGLTYTLGATTLGTLTYAYDAGGNRTTVGGTFARTGLPQALASATYDAANRIATWSGQALSYDANGNLASDGLTSYTWNARNQLAAITGATGASFAYDATGQRRARTTSGTTSYLYDGANAAQELVGGSSTANVLTGGIDEVFQRTDSAGVRAMLTDALGSTVALVDGSGALQTQYTYEPFGATSTSGAASANPAQFTGRENDGTGLYYYRPRYYNPQFQRFLSEDPIGFGAGDVNLSAYAFNAPTKFRDPSGRFVVPLLLCAGGAAGSAAGDAMAGRKFNPTKAAAWCAAGLTLGVAGPAIAEALGYGGAAATAILETSVAYSQRVVERMAGTAGNPYHNFPSSFNQYVVQHGDITIHTESTFSTKCPAP
jgi:RHS repeat-associated protein